MLLGHWLAKYIVQGMLYSIVFSLQPSLQLKWWVLHCELIVPINTCSFYVYALCRLVISVFLMFNIVDNLSASIQFNNPTYLRYCSLISHFLSLESYKRAEMSVLCKAYYFAFNQINLASLFEEI